METPNEPVTEVAVPNVMDEREAILAEMDALTEDPEGEPTETPAAQQAKELETDEAAEETEPAPAEDDVKTAAEPEPDLDEKKLAALQRQEKKQKEALAVERAEIEERAKAIAEREESIKSWEAAKARAAIDPVGVLEELGLTPEQFEDTARDSYNRRPGADVDRVTAQRNIKLREANSAAERALKRVEELEAKIQARDDQQAVQAKVTAYLSEAAAKLDEDTPILTKLHANNRSKFDRDVGLMADKLWQETGETPDHVDVIRELENTKRAELLELGIEPPKSGTKQPAQASQKPVGKTLTNELGNPTKPRTEPLTEEEEREEVLRGLAEL